MKLTSFLTTTTVLIASCTSALDSASTLGRPSSTSTFDHLPTVASSPSERTRAFEFPPGARKFLEFLMGGLFHMEEILKRIANLPSKEDVLADSQPPFNLKKSPQSFNLKNHGKNADSPRRKIFDLKNHGKKVPADSPQSSNLKKSDRSLNLVNLADSHRDKLEKKVFEQMHSIKELGGRLRKSPQFSNLKKSPQFSNLKKSDRSFNLVNFADSHTSRDKLEKKVRADSPRSSSADIIGLEYE